MVFYPAVKMTLEAAGYSVLVPAFPDAEQPVLGPWQNTLGEALSGLKPENTIIVGHSLGEPGISSCMGITTFDTPDTHHDPTHSGATNILRFLGSKTDLAEPYAGVILIGASANQTIIAGNWNENVSTFFAAPFDLPFIKRNSRQFITIHARDDVTVGTPFEDARKFQEMFDSKTIILPKGGHFWITDNCTDVPEVTAAVIDIFEGLRTRA